MRQEIKVAGNRMGALIGKEGSTKKKLEEKSGALITIDSKEGLVIVEGEDTLGVLRAVETVNAINRGFSPERSFCLLEDEDLLLDVIDLSAYYRHTATAGPAPGPDYRKRWKIQGADRGYDPGFHLGIWKNDRPYRVTRTDQSRQEPRSIC